MEVTFQADGLLLLDSPPPSPPRVLCNLRSSGHAQLVVLTYDNDAELLLFFSFLFLRLLLLLLLLVELGNLKFH